MRMENLLFVALGGRTSCSAWPAAWQGWPWARRWLGGQAGPEADEREDVVI